jgi:hypothetical protein
MFAIRSKSSLALLAVIASLAPAAVAQDQPKKFELGAETNQFNAGSSYPAYPAPQMIQQTPRQAPPQQPRKPLQGNAVQQHQPMQRPLQANIQQQPPMQAGVQANVLPQQFLGHWNVQGQRTKVQGATPEYQSGYERVFEMNTQNVWDITGRPGQYGINSNAGMQAMQLREIAGSTATFAYQHPVYMNKDGQMVAMPTNAQELVVMQLSPDGRSFSGLCRIGIVKPGEPRPRGMVTYNLQGHR